MRGDYPENWGNQNNEVQYTGGGTMGSPSDQDWEEIGHYGADSEFGDIS